MLRSGWILVGFLTVLAGGQALARTPTDSLVFRQIGFVKGKAEISNGQIKCEIPNVDNAILDGAYSFGLWNTYGVPTLFFPDINNPLGNPCGGWIQFHNFLVDQFITVDHVELKFSISGAKRFRSYVPTRNGFPTACREFRKQTVWATTQIPPANSSSYPVSSGGLDNAAFLQVLPMVDPQLLYCLRGQYAALDPNLFQSFQLVIKATAVGLSDAGDSYRSNAIQYSLSLRHTCGNGRVDDGELCDPNSVGTTCFGVCSSNKCSNNANLACTSDADCTGVCVAPGNPSECTCVY
ncbi:MAG: hypothetical protein U0807_04895 [Candidatus Binatia bacterium]